MPGIRKTIYVSSEEQWLGIKSRAEGAGLSISRYLLSGQFYEGNFRGGGGEQLDRIESKLDLLMKESGEIGGSEVPRETSDDMAMLAEKQAKLDADKAKRDIKKEKIAKGREFFSPQPKSKQLGKKKGGE